MRVCEACGSRMSPFQPRTRVPNGQLVCKGCVQRLGAEATKTDPKQAAAHEAALVPCGVPGCPLPAVWSVDGPSASDWGSDVCDEHLEQAKANWALGPFPPLVRRISTRKVANGQVYDPETIPPGWGAHIGNGEWVTRCPEEGCGYLIPGNLPVDIQRHLWDAHQKISPLLATRKVAHDSGDGATIYHCFACGAGQVVARSDGTAECGFCFAGETEYLTWDGVRTFKETVGTTQRVLVHESFRVETHKGRSRRGGRRLSDERVVEIRDLYADGVPKAELARKYGVVQGTIKKIVERVSWGHVGGGGHEPGDPVTQEAIWGEGHGTFAGRWVNAEIRSFGVQPLMKVTLSRSGISKEIYATAEHRWVVHPEFGSAYKYHQRVIRTTGELSKQSRLASLFPKDRIRQNRPTVPSPFGIANGFVWGDGSLDSRGGSEVTLWGEKDLALLPYFSASRQREVSNANGTKGVKIKDLPSFFKGFPPAAESLSYIYGWLAGYFAADGSVNEMGVPTISCADLGVLEQVRDLCTRLGVGTYAPTESWRVGLGQEVPSQIWSMVLLGQTLTPDFFIIPEHRKHFDGRLKRTSVVDRDPPGWTVVSVEETDRTEEVYCAVVPGDENFTLVDNINVMNCGVAFTVQVQPVRSAVPQTINGVPYDNPDLPGTPGVPPPVDDGTVDEETQTPLAPEPDPTTLFASRRTAGTFDLDEYVPEVGDYVYRGSEPVATITAVHGRYESGWSVTTSPDLQEIPGDGVVVYLAGIHSGDRIWKKISEGGRRVSKAYYLTAEGAALPEEAYLKHLAIRYADDRVAVIAAVRAAAKGEQAYWIGGKKVPLGGRVLVPGRFGGPGTIRGGSSTVTIDLDNGKVVNIQPDSDAWKQLEPL